MKIVHERPPVWDEICSAIGTPSEYAVFAWGDTIYVPSGRPIPNDLLLHEGVHAAQQADVGGPEIWWGRYISDPAFRLEQEVEAYRAQLQWFASRDARREARRAFARVLSGPLYGYICSFERAKWLLRGSIE